MRKVIWGRDPDAEAFIDAAEIRISELERDIKQYHAAILDTQFELGSGLLDGREIMETTCRARGLMAEPLDSRYMRVYEY